MLTVAESRKILGDEAKNLTDEELQDVLDRFYMMARILVKEVIEDKNNELSKFSGT